MPVLIQEQILTLSILILLTIWELKDYRDVIVYDKIDMAPHKETDHATDPVEGKTPPYGPIYSWSPI